MSRLIVIKQGQVLETIDLKQVSLRIGRGDSNDINLADETKFISREHAEVRFKPTGYSIVDLGSANGVVVGGQEVAEVPLVDGLRVQIGDYELVFEGAPTQPAADFKATIPVLASSLGPTPSDAPTLLQRPAELAAVVPPRRPQNRRARLWVGLSTVCAAAAITALVIRGAARTTPQPVLEQDGPSSPVHPGPQPPPASSDPAVSESPQGEPSSPSGAPAGQNSGARSQTRSTGPRTQLDPFVQRNPTESEEAFRARTESIQKAYAEASAATTADLVALDDFRQLDIWQPSGYRDSRVLEGNLKQRLAKADLEEAKDASTWVQASKLFQQASDLGADIDVNAALVAIADDRESQAKDSLSKARDDCINGSADKKGAAQKVLRHLIEWLPPDRQAWQRASDYLKGCSNVERKEPQMRLK